MLAASILSYFLVLSVHIDSLGISKHCNQENGWQHFEAQELVSEMRKVMYKASKMMLKVTVMIRVSDNISELETSQGNEYQV